MQKLACLALLVGLVACGGEVGIDTTGDPTDDTSGTTDTDGTGSADTTGDGDGDTSTGDGDGDTSTGDGDGDTSTGDGDGDGDGVCPDGNLDVGEECDDGDDDPDNGCSNACERDPDYACPAPGEPCIQVVVCGNGRIEGAEQCDDGDVGSGDGCSAGCQVEDGWSCPLAGTACVATRCGDGIVAGFEACDDGDNDADDGCSPTCQLEEGYKCPNAGAECVETTCGDQQVEGTEECDDGNLEVGDGCTPFCKAEPKNCSDGVCEAVCGDSVKQLGEGCDDGNTISGDGCTAACEVEVGFECQEVELPDPPEAVVPITIRDFIPGCGGASRPLQGETGAVAPFGHPDFQCYNGERTGMVETTLDADGKPVRIANDKTTSNDDFARWYRSDARWNKTLAQTLTLARQSSGAYRVDFTSFFPATGLGWDVEACNGSPCEELEPDGNKSGDQNFYFTSEVRFWFEFKGTEVLAFSGDDDVWVFINNRLAVDIGGVHGRRDRSVNLGNATTAQNLGLVEGGIYEAVVFQAERHTERSQYRLTLTNFNQAPSVCTDQCGDGEVSSREVCDDGSDNGAGDGANYGGCAADCTLEPYCGDGVVQEEFGEICDDGINVGGNASACAPGCQQLGARCGDGVLQPGSGEQCDDGNTDSGDGCSATCTIEIE